MANKLQTGTIGFFNGERAVIKTTRTFRFDRNQNKNIRGVELRLPDKDAKERLPDPYFKVWIGDSYVAHIFVPIKDFRKNFVYSEAATVLYANK